MRPGKFWFSTIALTVTAAVVFALAIAAITGTAALAFSRNHGPSQASFAQNSKNPAPNSTPDSTPKPTKAQTLTGVLTDAHCVGRHPGGSGLNSADCARICVKEGSSWALVDGDKVYVIKGDSPYFDKLAGQRVRVLGTLEGNTIKVQSVEPATG